jgi:glycosyltransferase involved in cell wall biosynthesis
LLGNGECGVLVPANDPWQMAYAILSLSTDNEKMEYYSKKGMEIARERHSAENIRKQLLNCYETLTN